MNWEKIIALLGKRAYFPILLLVVGISFFSAATLQSVPLPNNGFKIELRPMLHLPLGLLGVGLIACSILIFVMGKLETSTVNPLPSAPSDPAQPSAPMPATAASPADELNEEEFATMIEHNFTIRCSRTQKTIMIQMYEIPTSEIALDDFFEKYYRQNWPGLIDSVAELYYRVRDLSNLGLLDMVPFGKSTTIIQWNPRVGNILVERDILRT
jgi:hypothetical protein